MASNIAAQLREKLFDRPDPPTHQHSFADLTRTMFPLGVSFVDFLNERHFEEQVRLAKDILLRLAYESRIYPPTKLLFNLLEVESLLAGTAVKSNFNGRDHFVHLVNLYLLGLYVFWYHETLHKRVVAQFEELTSSMHGRSKLDRREDAQRTFIESWRDFVLFHDLGYPWETQATLRDAPRFLKPFSGALRYAAKDGALFALSQVLALEKICAEDDYSCFADDLRPYLSPSTATADLFYSPVSEFVEHWSNAIRLPFSDDDSLWSLVKLVVPKEDRLCLLESGVHGHAVASTNTDLHRFLSSKYRIEIESTTAIQGVTGRRLQEAVGTSSANETFHWVYYVRDLASHLASFTRRLFIEDESKTTGFRHFVQHALSQFQSVGSLSAGFGFRDLSFCIYQQLLSFLDFDVLEDTKADEFMVFHRLLRSELRGQQASLIEEIIASLRLRLQEKAIELNNLSNPISPNSVPLSEYLKQLLSVLSNNRKLATDVEKVLSNKIKSRVRLKKELFHYYSHLKSEVTACIATSNFAIYPEIVGDEIMPDRMPDWLQFLEDERGTHLSELLAERGLGVAALKKYRPDFANSSEPFLDHGISSGLLAAQLSIGWEQVLRKPSSPLFELLKLRGTPPLNRSAGKKGADDEVLYSIFVHNLYPKYFEDTPQKQFRTKLNKQQAFTYLALLCDSLQPWDRKRLFSQATGTPQYTTYAENFGIEIVGEIIRISERGDRLRIEEREAGLRKYLGEYLDAASQFVKLQLGEW